MGKLLLALLLAVVATPAAAAEWTTTTLMQLVDAVEDAENDGLDQRRYSIGALRSADGVLPETATMAALLLAGDLANGRIEDRASDEWQIADRRRMPEEIERGLEEAIANDDVTGWLKGLRPADPRYDALRQTYASTRDPALRRRLAVNMERWRWLRDLPDGESILVNVPSYAMTYTDRDGQRSKWTVIVGSPRTPTPQLIADAGAVTVNPWWYVPTSIARSVGSRGYVVTRSEDGSRSVRQRPGPGNSLGRFKFEMPNDHAIYLHDTPSKGLFARPVRALSHGCIRVKGIDDLVARVMDDAEQAAEIPRYLQDTRTRRMSLDRSIPVAILYFTAIPDETGKVAYFDDVYGRDEAIAKALGI